MQVCGNHHRAQEQAGSSLPGVCKTIPLPFPAPVRRRSSDVTCNFSSTTRRALRGGGGSAPRTDGVERLPHHSGWFLILCNSILTVFPLLFSIRQRLRNSLYVWTGTVGSRAQRNWKTTSCHGMLYFARSWRVVVIWPFYVILILFRTLKVARRLICSSELWSGSMLIC